MLKSNLTKFLTKLKRVKNFYNFKQQIQPYETLNFLPEKTSCDWINRNNLSYVKYSTKVNISYLIGILTMGSGLLFQNIPLMAGSLFPILLGASYKDKLADISKNIYSYQNLYGFKDMRVITKNSEEYMAFSEDLDLFNKSNYSRDNAYTVIELNGLTTNKVFSDDNILFKFKNKNGKQIIFKVNEETIWSIIDVDHNDTKKYVILHKTKDNKKNQYEEILKVLKVFEI